MERIIQSGTVTERIRRFNAHLGPEQVSLKYRLMSADTFRFFRGTCHLFYEDLSGVSLPYSPDTWISGDLHIENFGSFKGDNRLVYFDLNDFDESILAPASWELVRMTCSIIVGFLTLGIDEKKAFKWARQFLEIYAAILAKGKARYLEIETSKGITKSFLEKVNARSQKELLQSRVSVVKKKVAILADNKRYFRLDKGLRLSLVEHMNGWASLQEDKLGPCKVLDACFRIAGTGSLGVKRYVLILQMTEPRKRLRLIDMKQAFPSSLAPFVKVSQPDWPTEADRIIAIKYRMQNISPALLDTTVFRGDSYVLQEMQPTEDKINFRQIREHYRDISSVISDMALLTASAQLRSSGRQGSATADELIAFGNRDKWQDVLSTYAFDYSRIVNEDYLQFVKSQPII